MEFHDVGILKSLLVNLLLALLFSPPFCPQTRRHCLQTDRGLPAALLPVPVRYSAIVEPPLLTVCRTIHLGAQIGLPQC